MDLPDEEDYFDPTLVMNWEDECGGGGESRSSYSFSSTNDDGAGCSNDQANNDGASVPARQQPHPSDKISASSTTGVPVVDASAATTASATAAEVAGSLTISSDAMMTMIESYFPGSSGGQGGGSSRYGTGMGGNHPLAMTSMASCSPLDPVTAATAMGHPSVPSSAALFPPPYAMMHVNNNGGVGAGGGAHQQQQQQQQQRKQHQHQHQQSSTSMNNKGPGAGGGWSMAPYLPPLLLSSTGSGNPNPVLFNNNNNGGGGGGEGFLASIINGNVGGCGGGVANGNTSVDGNSGLSKNNINNNNNNHHHESNHSASTTSSGQLLTSAQQQINAAQDLFASHLHQLTSNFQASHNGNDNAGRNSFGMTMTAPLHVVAQPQHHHHHHYGITVNGFHPQVNALANNVLPLSGGGCSFGGLMHHQNIQLQQQQQQSAVTASGADQHPRIEVGGIAGATAKNDAVGNCPSSGGCSGNAAISLEAAISGSCQLSASALAIAAAANDNIRIREDADMPMMMGLMHARNSRERNEREQIRAKKITQLITDLRSEMQGGGWRMEMKSKYQVLSQCRDYMDYLKRYHKTKEADIAKIKNLFEEQQQRQKAMAMTNAQSNDDPESIVSSVANSTSRSSVRSEAELNVNEEDDENSNGSRPASSVDSQEDTDETKKGEIQHQKRKRATMYDDPQANNALAPPQQQPSNKKPLVYSSSMGDVLKNGRWDDEGVGEVLEEEQQSCADMSSISKDDDENMGNDSSTPGGRNIYFNKVNSNMSDMTYSNQGEAGEQGEDSASSVSSTAAVVRGLGSSQLKGHSRCHQSDRIDCNEGNDNENINLVKEINVCSIATANTSHHKKKRRGFHYDYREVFLKSNVPQFIATLSGRIVVWNDVFLLATGLSERDAKRLTIFSIVQSCQLSKLYKMVARALAETSITSNSATVAKDGPTSLVDYATPNADNEEWQSITLRCIPFSFNNKTNGSKFVRRGPKTTATNATQQPNPLYINVALMDDENRDQRCFHCVLTDCPGSNGKLGCVTPELFATLFATKKTAVA